MWNINRTADMEWLNGFLRRYPVVKWNAYHNKKNFSEGKDSPEKEIKVLKYVMQDDENTELSNSEAFESDHTYAAKQKT